MKAATVEIPSSPLLLTRLFLAAAAFSVCVFSPATGLAAGPATGQRSVTLIDNDWRFTKGDPQGSTVSLLYDTKPGRAGNNVKSNLLFTANPFIKDPAKLVPRPAGNLGDGLSYLAAAFDDASWRKIDLPFDSAIEGPFITTGGGGMGRLPTSGVSWYRKSLVLPASDAGKSLFLDFDGAMSFSEVWLNGQFVGGWPFGYSSFRLNITPYAKPGANNTLAVRLDNPPANSRWYPGAGIYRHVWLVETAPVYVGQWGTYITTPDATAASASIVLKLTVDNDSKQSANVSVATQIFELDATDQKTGPAVATIAPQNVSVPAGNNAVVETKGTVNNPKLWGTGKTQKPNRYVAVTSLTQNGTVVDSYETPFGIRTLKFDPNNGFFLNGEHIQLNGVCNHHDLGSLGAAFNYRAAQRQLEILQEMGCNALRTAHNPPAPELLDLCDKMGFLVMDEAFDCWEAQKTANDYHLLFNDWHEPDLRAMLRRDRNHPSIILWGIGNEVGEQGGDNSSNDTKGIAKTLTDICHQEDPTRITISAMNAASPTTPFVAPIDAIGLNYQGAGPQRRKTPGTPRHAPISALPSGLPRQVHPRQRNRLHPLHPRVSTRSPSPPTSAPRPPPMSAKSPAPARSVPTTCTSPTGP